MKRIPAIRSVMTAFPFSLPVEATIGDARAVMAEHDIRHLPIIEQGRPISLISDHDLRLVALAVGESPADHLPVRLACVRDAYVVELATPLDAVLAEMAEQDMDAAVVVREGRLVGVFTMGDACRGFCDVLHKLFGPFTGDDAA